jgi:RND superfamily putative drug exporter
VSLAGLLVFPQVFLRSMGYGGISAVLIAATAALTVMPALLAVLGHRVDALSVRPRRRVSAPGEHGFWYRLASSVMRRPVMFALPIVVLLLLLGSPFLNVKWGGVDSRVLPGGAEPGQVAGALLGDFPARQSEPITAAITLDVAATSPSGRAHTARPSSPRAAQPRRSPSATAAARSTSRRRTSWRASAHWPARRT